MDEPLISVIVPIYNVEKYLNRCIESIVNQTYKNLEIILVDDGSPDNCPQICDEWKEKDNRIVVIHSSNKGAGNARNIGLKIAKGNFISFIDSDDMISEDYIYFLYNLFDDETDITECEYINFFDEIDFPKNKQYTILKYTMEEAMTSHINNSVFKQVIWNKMYRKEIINTTYFPINKKIDDEFWTYKTIAQSRKLIHSSKVCYAYRQQQESVMHLLDNEKRFQGIDAKIERHKFILDNIPNLKNVSLINLWFECMYQCQNLLINKNDTSKKLIKKILKIINDYSINDIWTLNIPIKNKVWLQSAKISFLNTCKLRNKLKIGL